MTTAQDVLRIAAAEIGYREGSNNQTKYGAWYGLDNQPWCAEFVSWCLSQAGIPTHFAYCPTGVNDFKNVGRLYFNPQVGDVVFYNFGGRIAEHTGFVESVNADSSITTIEGNTNTDGSSNGIGVFRLTRKSGWLGFGRPAYSQSPTPLTPVSPEDDMPKWQSEITYPNGAKTQLFLDGSVNNFGTPYFGSMFSLLPEEKQDFTEARCLTANDPSNAAAGYTVWNQKGQAYGFTRDEWTKIQARGGR